MVSLWHWATLAHWAEYCVLGMLVFLYLRNVRGMAGAVTWGVAVPVGLIFACLDELHQRLIPGRMCALQDVGADTVGYLCGLAIAFAIKRNGRRAGDTPHGG